MRRCQQISSRIRLAASIASSLLLALFAPVTTNAAFAIIVTPPSGPPGTNVSLNGNIGCANCSFTVRFESVDVGSGITTSKGDVQFAFTIPSNSAFRGYNVSLTATLPLTISALRPHYFTINATFTVTQPPIVFPWYLYIAATSVGVVGVAGVAYAVRPKVPNPDSPRFDVKVEGQSEILEEEPER